MCQQSQSASTHQKTDATDLAPTDLSPTTNDNAESSPIGSSRSRARHSRTRHSHNGRRRRCANRANPPPLLKKRMQPISLQHQMTNDESSPTGSIRSHARRSHDGRTCQRSNRTAGGLVRLLFFSLSSSLFLWCRSVGGGWRWVGCVGGGALVRYMMWCWLPRSTYLGRGRSDSIIGARLCRKRIIHLCT